MRRFMRKAEGLAVAALALVGAGQVVVWMNHAMQYALVVYGQWETAEAAKAAGLPVLFSIQGVMRDCAAHLCDGMYEDNKRYTRSSPYGRVKNSQSRSDDSRKVG